MFRAELVTLAGEPLGQPAWRGLTIERVLNGGTTVACTIDADDQAAAECRIGERALRIWEDDALRFHGKLREPLVARPGGLDVTAGSPYTLLDRRQLQTAREFLAVDQGAIVADILAAENVRSPTRLRLGAHAASVARDRTYEAGKSVQELIAQLADVEDGFYFVERFVAEASSPTVYADLVLRWPDPGLPRPAVRFEFGEGTLANVASYVLTQALPVNGVTYVGGAEEGDVPSTRTTDAASIAAYDLLEQWFDDPDVTILSTLEEKAADRLRPTPIYTIELEIVPAGPSVGGPPVPRLFHDFGVGDTLTVSIRDEATTLYDLPLIATRAVLKVSENDDSEALDLTLESVAGGAL